MRKNQIKTPNIWIYKNRLQVLSADWDPCSTDDERLSARHPQLYCFISNVAVGSCRVCANAVGAVADIEVVLDELKVSITKNLCAERDNTLES